MHRPMYIKETNHVVRNHSPPKEGYATKGYEPNPIHHHTKEASSHLERLEKTV